MIAHHRRRRGVTTLSLLEVLVIVTILLLLIAKLLPAVHSASEAARRCRCLNNMMQIGIALQSYEAIHGVLPPGVVNETGPIKNIPKGYHFSWMTQILPLIDRKAVHAKLDYSVSLYDPINMTCRQTLISTFLCPSDPGPDRESDNVASSNYAACHNDVEAPIDTTNNGSFFLNSAIRYDDITDGTSQTIFVGEKKLLGGEFGWGSGTRSTLRNSGNPAQPFAASGALAEGTFERSTESPDPVGGFSSNHPGGGNYLFGDGSAKFIRINASSTVFQLLMNRADGELLSSDRF